MTTPVDLDAIRARLTARGLVITAPPVRIRDVAGPPPEAQPSIDPDIARRLQPLAEPENVVGDDAEALDPEPYGPTVGVRCPACRTTQKVAADATGYKCADCDKVWRWAVCSRCDHLALTIARQESWRCADCGGYSRSWWRTAGARPEAQRVTSRKRTEAAEREHRRILAVARRRRWKLIVGGIAVVMLAGGSALIFSETDVASPADESRAACATYTGLKSALANGAITAPDLREQLAALAKSAEAATPDVQLAAVGLAKSGRPGDATFLVASTQLSDACAATAR